MFIKLRNQEHINDTINTKLPYNEGRATIEIIPIRHCHSQWSQRYQISLCPFPVIHTHEPLMPSLFYFTGCLIWSRKQTIENMNEQKGIQQHYAKDSKDRKRQPCVKFDESEGRYTRHYGHQGQYHGQKRRGRGCITQFQVDGE